MIDESVIKIWLKEVTYLRSGWSFDFAKRKDGLHVLVNATEPDVCNPGEEFTISPGFRVPDEIATRQQFFDWILDTCIAGIQTHERYEAFRVAGRHWRDPHAAMMPAFATSFTTTQYGGP
jgi:hypothetical protein